MKVKILIGVLLFLIAVNLATIGSYVYLRFTHDRARTFFNREHLDRRFRDREHRPDLKLTKEQRKQLFSLFQSFRSETDSQRQHIGTLEAQTFQLLQQDPVPMDSVKQNLHKISDIRYDISLHIIQKLMEAKSFLNHDQQHAFYNAIMRARSNHPQAPPPGSPNDPPPQECP